MKSAAVLPRGFIELALLCAARGYGITNVRILRTFGRHTRTGRRRGPTEKQIPKYYLVETSVLPEVFIKVTEVKELLETGEARTVAEAAERVGLSRSAFYKYKDAVMPFREMKRGSIVTFQALLRDKKGVLSSLLAIFADTGANILTINQSIPTNGTAPVTISATTDNMPLGTDELITRARGLEGVLRFDALAG